jgi:hypothetical protein
MRQKSWNMRIKYAQKIDQICAKYAKKSEYMRKYAVNFFMNYMILHKKLYIKMLICVFSLLFAITNKIHLQIFRGKIGSVVGQHLFIHWEWPFHIARLDGRIFKICNHIGCQFSLNVTSIQNHRNLLKMFFFYMPIIFFNTEIVSKPGFFSRTVFIFCRIFSCL